MSGTDTRGALDRYVGTIEAAPVAAVQFLYRSVLRHTQKGRESPSFQADPTAWLRQAQRGERGPEWARDMFLQAAELWALLAGVGILVGMALDHVFGVPFDAVLTFSLSVFPAFGLLSLADAVRARSMREAEAARRQKRKRLGKKKQPVRCYQPIRRRWIIPVAASVLLTTFWTVLLSTG
ncbi:hypothetical protein [Streptomyces cyaneofuscatus]|uniref:hypothetical protein n=1 Tax=Streptomyces cyaneofuscatus TaxID=66883 RepID=UPI0036D7F8BF